MRTCLTLVPFLLFAQAAGGNENDTQTLEVIAAAATAAVDPAANGRRALQLPGLQFRFQLRLGCRPPFEAASASVTVADTRRVVEIGPAERASGTARAVVGIDAGQIPPVAVAGFCTSDIAAANDRAGPETLTVASALSATAALRCVAGDEAEVVYAGLPLDVVLRCDRPPADEAPPLPGTVSDP